MKTRNAFTLVELLVVIIIILIISSMVLFALASTQTSARDAKTRGTITKINDLISRKYESYLTRRVPVKITSGESRTAYAKRKLSAIREIMKMEMPDRYSDFGYTNGATTQPVYPTVGNQLTAWNAVAKAYWRKAKQGSTSSGKDITLENIGAECLYLLVALGNDEEGIENFSESEVGDVDNDGMKEFIDGWGRPIYFIRWAPQFASEIQMPGAPFPLTTTYTTELAKNNHDPFDPFIAQTNAYALIPLIFSAGTDGDYNIYSGPSTLPNTTPADPFDTVNIDYGKKLNTTSTGELDNITNHELLSP
jgi:prepilin-type N-terminal cleavage/methylation domain-containing protein